MSRIWNKVIRYKLIQNETDRQNKEQGDIHGLDLKHDQLPTRAIQ